MRGWRSSRTLRNCGLADAIPVLQRGFEIPLEKVGGAEKVVDVIVVGREAEGLAQAANRLRILFLREGDAGQLDGKSWIAGRKAAAGFERGLRFRQASEMRQGDSQIEIHMGCARADGFSRVTMVVPLLLVGEALQLIV